MNSCKLASALLTALICASCAVGPDYRRPDTKVPETWSEAPDKGVSIGSFELVRWWETLNDPVLNTLVERAIKSNPDLRLAEARLREARAAREMATADLWPSLNASGSYSRAHAGIAPSSKEKSTTSLFQIGFDAAWELDIFGGLRRSVEAAQASVGAAKESHRDVIVSLLAEIARNYVELCGLQQQIAITKDNIKTQSDTVELTQARFAVGLASEIDVLKASSQLTNTQSQIPILESLAKHSIHRLGILLGSEPGALIGELSCAGNIPPVPPDVPVDLPSDLLRRRPDIRAAERELAAATARIGVAVADLFPRFSLTGSLGRQGLNFSDLGDGTNKFWKVGPTIEWPIFEAGRIRANINIQNARQEQALAFYEKTVLAALEEVENALVDYAKEQASRNSLIETVDANLQSVSLSTELYAKGLTDFLTVLDAERSLYTSQDQLVQSEKTVVLNLIALYKAMGGGWEAYSKPD
ncbi:Transcriptional regulator, Fis family [uncultured Desulfobacterium sp.]|uniref:Transcriptional regulator, Fis family n=1 Tax=uncultured Desulfobacterium sp. TaxID=201089 RepID=A0A445MVR0_9BACT|nr:Transcriptional regulator, Fis family [uncultured Desulfobacterium sp.]